MNQETRVCRNCKQSFVIEPDDFSFYEKMGVPPPALCPKCRFRRRAAFRNEQTLYKRECGLCKKKVVSMYHDRSPYTVYCNDCWFSDKWDAGSYAQNYELSRPFLEQLKELTVKVPVSATYTTNAMGPNVNSEYTNFAGSNKDCYLCFNSGPSNENCAYCRGIMRARDTFDTYYGYETERAYEGVNVQKSTGVVWGQNVLESLNSWFLLNCVNVQNCFGCVNLRHKSFYFFNKPLSKEEWKKQVEEIVGSYEKMEATRKRFEEYAKKFPRRENNNLKSVHCTGEYIFESKNCHECFEVSESEDLKYSFATKFTKESYDLIGHGRNAELLLEGVGVGLGQRVIAGWWVENSHDIEYSFVTRASEYCFGCVGIKNGKYRILNKEYGENEYKALRAKIVEELKSKGEYGLFFPPSMAFFAYNETIGQDNMPISKEQAMKEGYRWEEVLPMPQGQETLTPERIPDHIRDVKDSLLQEVLRCVECTRNYRLIPAELAFYRRMVIPVPRKCPACRFLERLERRGPFMLFDRTCDHCKKVIRTSYAPDRPEIVYCEECYQREVI